MPLDCYFLPLEVLLPPFGAVGAGVLAGLAAGLAADFAIFLSFHKINAVIIAHFYEICAVFGKKYRKKRKIRIKQYFSILIV